MLNEEIWKAIPGWDGIYEASSAGRVRRVLGGRGARAGHILRPATNWGGYQYVVLAHGGVAKTRTVHRLVATAFLQAEAGRPHLNHIDGVKTNNAASNLEWCSSSENHAHRFRALGHVSPRGSRNGRAKLDEAIVAEIWALRTMAARRAAGTSRMKMSADIGVHPNVISRIWRGLAWRHVTHAP